MRFPTLAAACALLLALPATAQDKGDGPPNKVQLAQPGDPGRSASPGTTPLARLGGFSENFDSVPDGNLPAGWREFEAGTGLPGGPAWTVRPYSPGDPSLGKLAGVAFEDVPDGEAVDYLVTPQVSIQTGFQLTATLYDGLSTEFGSNYEIRVSTTGNATPAEFTDLLASYTEGDLPFLGAAPAPVMIDLTGYAGMDIYIAFVLSNDDGDDFYVDDVSVGPAPMGPIASVTPSVIEFDDVPVGTTGEEIVTVTNIGSSLLTISNVSVAPAEPFDLDLSTFDDTLEPGESSSYAVTFSPSREGTFLAFSGVDSNDPDSPTTIGLIGTGVSPPPNDNLADAIRIFEGDHIGDNLFAGLEDGEPVPSCQDDQGASVWYLYTPDVDGAVYVDLSRSDFDTVLSLYVNNGSTLDEIACDDDSGNFLTSRLPRVEVAAGTDVLIRVAGFDGTSLGGVQSEGDFGLQVEIYDGDASETSAFSRSIVPGDVFNRPDSDGDGTPGSCFTSTGEVSYDTVGLTVGADGVYDFTATWGGFDGYLLLYESPFDPASPCSGLLGRDDDHDPGSGSPEDGSQIADVFLYATGDTGRGGPEYTLVATTFGPGDSGGYDLEVVGTGAVESFAVAAEDGPEGLSVLSAVRPNPTAEAFQVDLALSTAEAVRVSVLDVLGREVAVVHAGPLAAGTTTLTAAIDGLPAGPYLLRALGPSVRETRSLTVVR